MLGYVANDARAFKTFVASRLHMIKENSNVEQWKYVPSKKNPADDASRGLNFKNFVQIDKLFHGPKFLWKSQPSCETSSVPVLLRPEDLELKKQVKTNKIAVEDEEKYWRKILMLVEYEIKISTGAQMEKLYLLITLIY